MNINRIHVQRLIGMCAIVVLVIAVFPMPSDTANTIILVGTADIKDSAYGKWLSLIYTEVFRRLGYELQYTGYPSARASAMSDAGEVDGEISRVFEYQATHPNVIRVDEAAYSSKFVALAARPGIVLQGWKSLQKTTYNVEYRRGSKLPETELPLVVAPEHLSSVTTVEQGLKKLIVERTDIYVDTEGLIVEAMKSLDPAEFDVSSLYQAGVMQEIGVYAYLHKKHAALVPKVAEILKALKQEGLIEHYRMLAFEQQ